MYNPARICSFPQLSSLSAGRLPRKCRNARAFRQSSRELSASAQSERAVTFRERANQQTSFIPCCVNQPIGSFRLECVCVCVYVCVCVCVCIAVCLCSVCVVLFVDCSTSDDLSHAFCKVVGGGGEGGLPPFFMGGEGAPSFF